MPFKHDGFDEIDYVCSLLLDYNKFNFSTNNLKCFQQDYLKKYYNSTNIFPIMNIHNEIFSIDSLKDVCEYYPENINKRIEIDETLGFVIKKYLKI